MHKCILLSVYDRFHGCGAACGTNSAQCMNNATACDIAEINSFSLQKKPMSICDFCAVPKGLFRHLCSIFLPK